MGTDLGDVRADEFTHEVRRTRGHGQFVRRDQDRGGEVLDTHEEVGGCGPPTTDQFDQGVGVQRDLGDRFVGELGPGPAHQEPGHTHGPSGGDDRTHEVAIAWHQEGRGDLAVGSDPVRVELGLPSANTQHEIAGEHRLFFHGHPRGAGPAVPGSSVSGGGPDRG